MYCRAKAVDINDIEIALDNAFSIKNKITFNILLLFSFKFIKGSIYVIFISTYLISLHKLFTEMKNKNIVTPIAFSIKYIPRIY